MIAEMEQIFATIQEAGRDPSLTIDKVVTMAWRTDMVDTKMYDILLLTIQNKLTPREITMFQKKFKMDVQAVEQLQGDSLKRLRRYVDSLCMRLDSRFDVTIDQLKWEYTNADTRAIEVLHNYFEKTPTAREVYELWANQAFEGKVLSLGDGYGKKSIAATYAAFAKSGIRLPRILVA